MSLSSRIVQRGVATIREVEEALARQVLYGGDLVTNLLEVSRIEEAQLLTLVGEEHALPIGPIGELPSPTPEAQRMVAGEVALERSLIPLSLDAGTLVVAVAEPLSKDTEQELTFALAVPLHQVVAPLVRIRQALARDYGIPMDRRTERLLERIVTGGPRNASSFPAPPREQRQPPRPPSVRPPPTSRIAKASERPPLEGTPTTLLRSVAPAGSRPATTTKRRRGPLTMDAAKRELEAATERDTILDRLFEFARQFFDYAALFIVHGDLAEGRDAFGSGAARDVAMRIGVPLDLPSLLATAKSEKKLARGAGDRAGVDGVLMKDLGRPFGSECVALPVVVRTRVVALVFGDGGDGGIDDQGLADVEKMVAAASAAFERVIVRKKLRGSVPPDAEAEAFDKNESDHPVAPGEAVPPTKLSKRPSVEELAAPIRDLIAEGPASLARETTREPTPAIVPPKSAPPKSAPPPANVLAVNRPSGRPIPREDPQSNPSMPVAASAGPISGAGVEALASPPPRTKSSGNLRRAIAPPLVFTPQPFQTPAYAGTPAPPTVREPEPPPMSPPALPETAITHPPSSPKAHSPPPPAPAPRSPEAKNVTDVSPENLPMFPAKVPKLEVIDDEPIINGDETPAAPAVAQAESAAPPVKITSVLHAQPVKPMPPSEQQISVAPHRPPSSSEDSARGLPSIIVDVSGEFIAVVDRVIAAAEKGGEDEDAEGELLRAGGQAMPAIMSRFPGPIVLDPEDATEASAATPRVAECGPVLRLVASQRRTALPFVLSQVADDDADKRFWATYLLTELVYAEAIDPVIDRIFDDVARVRRAARIAARALAEVHPGPVVERLEPVAADKTAPQKNRLLAVSALGETREPLAVTALLPLLDDGTKDIASAARTGLVTITRQDFGVDAKKWDAWWLANKERHRIEWLIDALTNEQATLRAAAGEELKTLTKEFFGYYDDLPKKERERAQQRYREWWQSVGRVRFSRR